MGRKNGAEILTAVYNKFRGADFSTDPSLVAKYRSPLCTNIVADAGGVPEKRPGWRTLHALPGAVHGLFAGVFGGAERRLVHAGTALYVWDETDAAPVPVLTGLPECRSRGVNLGGKLWIVTGSGYLVYDGETAMRVTAAEPYVPTVIITREPAGGGTTYEDVNMLTPYRKDAFQTNGSSTVFTLDTDELDAEGAVRAWVWGAEQTEGTDFTVDRAAGTVTFAAPPAAPAAGSADGLVVQFPKTVEGYADMIDGCTIVTTFGVGTNDRAVLSGNPAYPNRDWISALDDPTYIPDLSYAAVGEESVPIMGYCRVGASLAILKADNGQDTTVFLRSADTDGGGNAVFPLRQAISGVGAAAKGAFAALLDDPLFLSATGVCAVTTSNLTSEKITQNRSYYLNAQLCAEPGLSSAEAVVWNGLYLLSVGNGRVYALDGRQKKTYRSESLGDYVYEGYYWENVPAACWLCRKDGDGESLYFGTADGKLCRFSSDLDSVSRFSDDGAPVKAVWATKYDDDGAPSRLKTLLKTGCCVTIKPYARSSGTVYFRTDRSDGTEREVSRATMDILDLGDIDFERFTFSSDESPQEIFFRRKVKNYKRLQIIVRNDEADEGFGVYQITKHYVAGNFARR